MRHGKLKAAFGDIDGPYLAGKVIKAAEKISVDLQQAFYAPHFDRVDEAAFKQRIGFFATLSVNGGVAVGEPIQELGRFVVGEVFGQKQNTISVSTSDK